MIHRTEAVRLTKKELTENWQKELSNLISTPESLFDYLDLDRKYLPEAKSAHGLFPVRATRPYLERIKKGDIHDPLLRQILPLGAEHDDIEGYSADPLNEVQANTTPGIIHKYHGRLLMITATQCAINCRYCFRRHFDYQANKLSRSQWQTSLDYIRANPSIEEVILSGGDPLAVSDNQLSWLIDELNTIPHLTRLRIHSRFPIVLPCRIDPNLTHIMSKCRLKLVFVVHCNHAQEIDEKVSHALLTLKQTGFTLLNQAVLLKGINDSGDSLADLSHALFDCGVLPYYLHVLDPVKGAAHFDILEEKAQALHRHLLAQLPGYLVPKLVREVPGAASKIPIV